MHSAKLMRTINLRKKNAIFTVFILYYCIELTAVFVYGVQYGYYFGWKFVVAAISVQLCNRPCFCKYVWNAFKQFKATVLFEHFQ